MVARIKCLVAFEDAVKLVGNGDRIHTFRQAGACIIGADWDRQQILDAMQKYGVEESGDSAQAMYHGLALCDDRGWLFIETDKE